MFRKKRPAETLQTYDECDRLETIVLSLLYGDLLPPTAQHTEEWVAFAVHQTTGLAPREFLALGRDARVPYLQQAVDGLREAAAPASKAPASAGGTPPNGQPGASAPAEPLAA